MPINNIYNSFSMTFKELNGLTLRTRLNACVDVITKGVNDWHSLWMSDWEWMSKTVSNTRWANDWQTGWLTRRIWLHTSDYTCCLRDLGCFNWEREPADCYIDEVTRQVEKEARLSTKVLIGASKHLPRHYINKTSLHLRRCHCIITYSRGAWVGFWWLK